MSHAFSALARLLFLVLMSLVSALPLARAQACPDRLPTHMRAVQQVGFGGPEVLALASLPVPQAQPGEVLLRVAAAAVNPIDWKRREHGRGGLPFVPGYDVAGVVVAVGEGVTGWRCGDAAMGWLWRGRQGGYAEYVPVPVADLAPKPPGLSFREAAAIPLVALTAWGVLFDEGRLQPGQRVLIHAGAGGVGSIAIQLAKRHGAFVITTASARNHDYVRALGADEAIDYAAVDFASVVKDVDLVLDAVGGDTLARSVGVLRRGGSLVSIVATPDAAACAAAGIRCAARDLDPAPGTLVRIAEAFARGELRLPVERHFPLAEAAAAQELNRAGRTRGKIVIDVAQDAGAGTSAP
jgi:NADPH:quinone reductase-like Zn-dependent oxidoreductase